MATGKQSDDIFKPGPGPSRDKPSRADQVRAATNKAFGRPPAAEPYTKVTVPLYNRQVILLDTAALAIKAETGEHVSRADLIRALIDRAAPSLDPAGESFGTYTRKLLSGKA